MSTLKLDLILRKIGHNDEPAISELCKSVFFNSVSSDYSSRGKNAFLTHITPSNIKKRLEHNTLLFVAENKTTKTIIGVLELKNFHHITLFFVDNPYQQNRIGKMLLLKCIEHVRKNHVGVQKITVDAPVSSVKIYEKLGFWKLSGDIIYGDIKYIPMTLII